MSGPVQVHAIADHFESDFLAAWDLNEPKVATIEDVTFEEVQLPSTSKKVEKVILSFEKASRRMVCNKTNARVLYALYGRNARDWVGKRIEIYVTTTYLKGQVVDCLRLRKP